MTNRVLGVPEGYEARYYWDGTVACRMPGCCEPSIELGAQPTEQAAIEASVQRDEARWRQSLAMRVALGVRSERGATFAARALASAFDLRGER